MLKLKNIKKSYKTGDFIQHALRDVSLEFRKNEFVAVLGASGSGKTTLLNIVGGLDRYDSGDLIINNKSTKKFKDSEWDSYRNNSIGFVFQSYNLINHISVLENVEMGMTLSGVSLKKRRNKAKEVLKRVDLLEHSHKKPNQLSGGQMQRVAIARALANNPDIILADEPTGALDSKTSVQIMELIKEIAKDKLVIMVTHNDHLASNYANRIVKLKDGEVIEDTNPILTNDLEKTYVMRKTSMSFMTALKLSFNNIITKKGRTILTAFASSIGIIGIALILSLSNGFDKQISNFETDTLASFPIMISEQANSVNLEEIRSNYNDDLVDYPTVTNVIPFDISEARSIHFNKITDEYIDYIENINQDYASGISYSRTTNLNILVKNNDSVKIVDQNTANFMSLPKDFKDSNYVDSNYDLLSGRKPNNKYELLLEVDRKNRLEKSILEEIGFKTDAIINFDTLVGYEFKLVLNNDYYTKLGNIYTINNNIQNLYDDKDVITLKIVGIIRPNIDNSNAAERQQLGGIYYQDDLISDVISINKESNIVKDQLASEFNVLTGAPAIFKDKLLVTLGSVDIPSMINIYPKDFDSKQYILDYLDEYNTDLAEDDKIIYLDLAATISSLSGDIMNAITIVLIAFSAISLVVSSIMIGIITYISVIERTKEIGILRALGARKRDVTRVFNAETFIIGLSSGLMGVLITRLLIIPINIVLYNITELENVAQMNMTHILGLLIVSTTLTLIGGFIPAKIASRKDPVEALRTE